MFQLKQISHAALPGALAKAERYRLLNEPEEAESICRDVLVVQGDHQAALVTLLLALTDQFSAQGHEGTREAETILGQLTDEYQRAYFAGIIRERWARALLAAGDPGHQAFSWLRDAMRRYEAAETLTTDGNDEPILRWNTCARVITRRKLHAEPEPDAIDQGDAAPHRR